MPGLVACRAVGRPLGPPPHPPPLRRAAHPRWRSDAGWPRCGRCSAPPAAPRHRSGLRVGGQRKRKTGAGQAGGVSALARQARSRRAAPGAAPRARPPADGAHAAQARADSPPARQPASEQAVQGRTRGVAHVVDLAVGARGVPKPPVLRLVPLPPLVRQHLPALHAALRVGGRVEQSGWVQGGGRTVSDAWRGGGRRRRGGGALRSGTQAQQAIVHGRKQPASAGHAAHPQPHPPHPPGTGCPATAAPAGTRPARAR